MHGKAVELRDLCLKISLNQDEFYAHFVCGFSFFCKQGPCLPKKLETWSVCTPFPSCFPHKEVDLSVLPSPGSPVPFAFLLPSALITADETLPINPGRGHPCHMPALGQGTCQPCSLSPISMFPSLLLKALSLS